jgi:hypothetical protein
MCNKRNRAASVRCHPTMNWPIPVASTGLWASCEPLRCHVLKIVRPYIFRDVYRFEIPPNRNIVPAFETPIPRCFFAFFCASYQKSHNLLHATKNYISKHKFFSKKNPVLFSILPSCRVIFPHPPHNSVMLTVPAEFVLCINKQV